MRTPLSGGSAVDCLFKSVTLLMVNQQDLQQIMREVDEWQSVSNHPNITRFYGSVWDHHHHRLVIISEYMDKHSLKDHIHAAAVHGRGIPEDVAGVIIAQTVAGLAHLHRGVHRMHRNIKPSNILLNSQGQVKITDLGQSAKLQHTLDACNTMIASQIYMSPERVVGGKYTSNCDVWSVGIVLVEMIRGKHPYDRGDEIQHMNVVIDLISDSDPPVLVSHLDRVTTAAAADLSAKCLVWDRELRPTSVQLHQDDVWLQRFRAPAATQALVAYLQS